MPDKIKVIIAAHKPYWMPDDPLYLPVHVGAAGKDVIPGYQRDDEGDNISTKNPHYCELTGVYWAWKNLDADYVGLAHYRRHFRGKGPRNILTLEEAKQLLSKAPVVVPKKTDYVISTVEQHYADTHSPEHLVALRKAVATVSPEYLDAYDACMKHRSAHMLNMFLMRRDLFDAYCGWMFSVLREAEKGIDYTGMTPFQARLMGRLSELLLDVWLQKNSVSYVECPLVSMERVNWFKKGSAFLASKFLGKNYSKSF